MKITVLVDNNTIIDRYFFAEPGLSLFIEDGNTRILFDVGYSDLFIKNANKLKLNLLDLDFLVFSHGHLDHTWGIDPLIKLYSEAIIEKLQFHKPTVVAHDLLFKSASFNEICEFSTLISEEKLAKHFKMQLSRKPLWLTDTLVFLGEIERKNEFESVTSFGKKEGSTAADFVPDDSAIVYKGPDGLVIITGCSHSGICNITEYAKKVCNENRIVDIIGGLHLMNPDEKQMQGTVDYVSALKLKQLHACHCTDLNSKISLSRVAPIKEVGVGLTIEYL